MTRPAFERYYVVRSPIPKCGLALLLLSVARGELKFAPEIALPSSGYYGPMFMRSADVDLDGDIDYFLNNGNYLAISWNDGAGNFSIGTTSHTIAAPDLVGADLDRDGDLDFAGSGVIFRSDGLSIRNAASLTKIDAPWLPSSSHPPLAGDFNGDGWTDLAMVYNDARLVRILKNPGSLTALWETVDLPVASAHAIYFRCAVADLDEDGRSDLIIPNSLSNNAPAHLSVFWGSDDGTFAETPLANASSVVVGDLDRDGLLDLVAVVYKGLAFNVEVVIARQSAERVFTTSSMFISGLVIARSCVDVDADGWPDVIGTQQADYGSDWLRNDGAGGLLGSARLTNRDYKFAGDLDQDGDLDVVAAGPAGYSHPFLYRNLVIDSPVVSAREVWRTKHFGSPENTGDGADLADPDGDKLVNLVEYAGGSDPRSHIGDDGKIIELRKDPGTSNVVIYLLVAYPWPSEIGFSVGRSRNGISWDGYISKCVVPRGDNPIAGRFCEPNGWHTHIPENDVVRNGRQEVRISFQSVFGTGPAGFVRVEVTAR